MVRLGCTDLFFTSVASTRAISLRSPTPDALSFAPGSCTCALTTYRSDGATLPCTSATKVISSDGYIFDFVFTRTVSGPFASAARSLVTASYDIGMPQALVVVSNATDPNWME